MDNNVTETNIRPSRSATLVMLIASSTELLDGDEASDAGSCRDLEPTHQ